MLAPCANLLQNCLSDLVCQRDQAGFEHVKNKDVISSKFINSCHCINITNDFEITGISQCQCHRHIINNCKNTTNQKPSKHQIF